MKAIVVTDQAAGTAGMKLIELHLQTTSTTSPKPRSTSRPPQKSNLLYRMMGGPWVTVLVIRERSAL